MEDRAYALGLFLDFKKAFDSMQHNILLRKLDHYGICGIALDFIKNYLENRYQYVTVGKFASNNLKIKHCVPQDSILGPLLFITYINGITSIANNTEMVMYADDANIFFSGGSKQSLETQTNNYLNSLLNRYTITKFN